MKVVSVTVTVPLHPSQDPPTHHHGLRMERNRHCASPLGQMFSLITELEMRAGQYPLYLT